MNRPVTQTLAVATAALLLQAGSVRAAEFALSERCPPGFEKTDRNTCRLHTRYDRYDSLDDRGVGGLKTALPPRRDGFSPQQIDLGRYLFFDPLLSGNHTQSCASCHRPDRGFTDGLARSLGANGKPASRSAPTLWNTGFLNRFFWDGRAGTLEAQMQGPLYAEAEMANTPAQLLADLNGNGTYRQLFARAFPGQAVIRLEQVYTAIAAFEASLISLNSRYDRYAHGYHQALNEDEVAGLNVFRSFVARCAECHTPPLFTNQQIAVIGVPPPEGQARDPGAGTAFDHPDWHGGFKVPTLRNIAQTAPYMHAGQFDTLREAVEFYTRGRGHALAADEAASLHWHIWEPELTDVEIDRVVDFLKTLTDERFVPQVPDAVPSGLAVNAKQEGEP